MIFYINTAYIHILPPSGICLRPQHILRPTFLPLSFLTTTTCCRACVVLGVSGIAYGLSRPSPSPAFEDQNDLPTVWSGQLPYFCICMTLNATNLRIVAYLRFWKERRQASRRSLTAAGTRDSDKRNRDGRLKRPSNVNSSRVAPNVEEKICLSPISEGSEHSSSSASSSVLKILKTRRSARTTRTNSTAPFIDYFDDLLS